MLQDFHFKFAHKYYISANERPGTWLMSKFYGAALIRGQSLKREKRIFQKKKSYSYKIWKLCNCVFPNNRK